MNRQLIGRTYCDVCGGTGRTPNNTLCTRCRGTGFVAVSIEGVHLGADSDDSRERRRFVRYCTDLPLSVLNFQGRNLYGRCLVIAEGGLSGMLPEPLPVGTVVRLRLAVPTRSTPLEVGATVRYRLDPLYHGFEFESLTEEERLSIRQFCDELAIQPAARAP